MYPDPAKDPDKFVDFMVDFVKGTKVDVVMPVTDITTIPLTQSKHLFTGHSKIPFPDAQIVERVADKVEIYKLARSIGVDTPESTIVWSKNEIDSIEIGFNFPVVIKPSRSRIRRKNGWLYTAVSYSNDKQSLSESLSNMPPDAYPVLIQERIHGPGCGIFLCYQKGSPVAGFSHKRLREKPPSGGVSVLRTSIPLDPLTREFAERLLTTLKWEGVAMVEFKIDSRDKRPKLMEINGRFWGSLQLAIDSKVNFPEILLQSLEAEPVAPVFDYKYGVKTRWLWGDIDALLIRMFKNQRELQLPQNADGLIYSLLKFLIFWEPNLHYEVLSLTDPKPWVRESIEWFSRILHK